MKRKTEYIYVPDNWIQLIANAQKIFVTVKMTPEDFLSTETIGKCLINRKIDKQKCKVNWLRTRWMQYRKSNPKTLYFKETLNEEIQFR